MRILLDTHILLWAITDNSSLSEDARQFILDDKNQLFVSSASVWEVSIKHSLNPDAMPVSGKKLMSYVEEAGYFELPMTSRHAATVDGLPMHHKDPFDRMLIAQAVSEPMRLLTHDQKIAQYGEFVIKV